MYKIMPEANYECQNLSMDEIRQAYVNGDTITGFVEHILVDSQELIVRLGQDIFACLPFAETTIYPFKYSKKLGPALPTTIRNLLGRIIRAKITNIQSGNILLSRKKNMEEAYHHLCSLKRAKLYITQVISKSVFGDIGEGLVGKMHISEVCKCHIKTPYEFLRPDHTVDVAILSVDNEMHFATSYRQTFAPYKQEDYPIGIKIKCRIGEWVKIADISKYFVSVTPQVAGFLIINKHMYLDYGSEVECKVIDSSDKGLLLDFVRVI